MPTCSIAHPVDLLPPGPAPPQALISSSPCSIVSVAMTACTSDSSLPLPPCCGKTRNCPTCPFLKLISLTDAPHPGPCRSFANAFPANLPFRLVARLPELSHSISKYDDHF